MKRIAQKSKRQTSIRYLKPDLSSRNYHKNHERKKIYFDVDLDDYTQTQQFLIRVCRSKYSWEDEGDALVCAQNISKGVGPCRVYKCPHCGKYHITTQIHEELLENYA